MEHLIEADISWTLSPIRAVSSENDDSEILEATLPLVEQQTSSSSRTPHRKPLRLIGSTPKTSMRAQLPRSPGKYLRGTDELDEVSDTCVDVFATPPRLKKDARKKDIEIMVESPVDEFGNISPILKNSAHARRVATQGKDVNCLLAGFEDLETTLDPQPAARSSRELFNVSRSSRVPIHVYRNDQVLLNVGKNAPFVEEQPKATMVEPSVDLFANISPIWRNSAHARGVAAQGKDENYFLAGFEGLETTLGPKPAPRKTQEPVNVSRSSRVPLDVSRNAHVLVNVAKNAPLDKEQPKAKLKIKFKKMLSQTQLTDFVRPRSSSWLGSPNSAPIDVEESDDDEFIAYSRHNRPKGPKQKRMDGFLVKSRRVDLGSRQFGLVGMGGKKEKDGAGSSRPKPRKSSSQPTLASSGWASRQKDVVQFGVPKKGRREETPPVVLEDTLPLETPPPIRPGAEESIVLDDTRPLESPGGEQSRSDSDVVVVNEVNKTTPASWLPTTSRLKPTEDEDPTKRIYDARQKEKKKRTTTERERMMHDLLDDGFRRKRDDAIDQIKMDSKGRLRDGDVVRNRDDRRRLMHGQSCPCCQGYYDALGLSPEAKQKYIDQVSRHRYVHQPMPATPEHYWDLEIAPEDELERRGLIHYDSQPLRTSANDVGVARRVAARRNLATWDPKT